MMTMMIRKGMEPMSEVEQCAETIDVAVVGAGPAGLTAGLYAARAGLKTIVFGNRYDAQLARAEIVENYPAQLTPLSGLELIELLAQHAAKFNAQLNEQEIRQIKREGDRFYLFTSGGECYPAYAVILAMGTKRRQLGVPGEKEYQGRGVAYCTICDGPLFRNMPVAVIGFGDEAAAAALRMSSIAASVDLIVPRPRLDAGEEWLAQLRQTPYLTLIEGAKVEEILGDAAGVSGVRITVNGQQHIRAVRGVFLEVGLMPVSALAVDLGVEVTEDQFVRVGRLQETNVPGVFAAGDITGHRARQTVISAGEGATAAVHAVDYIKSNGLGGERKHLRLIQWGALSRPAPAAEEPAPSRQIAAPPAVRNALLDYVRSEPAYQPGYQAYQPDVETIAHIRAAMPRAKVIVIAASWCPDCRRNVPKLARISEHLPDWDFSVYGLESAEARQLGARAIPTIVVFDPSSGREFGRIVEEPKTGSIERDLWDIVSQAAQEFTEV